MVAPFLVPLRRWIGRQRKMDALAGNYNGQRATKIPAADAAIEDETAGEASTQEEEAIHPTSRDIDRLFGNLRVSQQPPALDSLPEVLTTTKPTQDPASELKRMLSVGPQSFPQQAPAQAPLQSSNTSADLLSILRGNPVLPNPLTSSEFPPQTPAEQISEAPSEPKSPMHQNRVRELPITAPQPPSFPLTSLPQSLLQEARKEQSLQERLDALNNAVKQQSKMQSPTDTTINQTLRRDSLAFRPAQVAPSAPKAQAPSFTQQMPGPFQRPRDPNSSGWQQFGEIRSPPAPAANKLPLPKLNSHTIGLLNTFKGNTAAPLVSPIESSAPGFRRPKRNFPVETISGGLNGAISTVNRPGLTAPANPIQRRHSPAMTVSPPGTATNGYSSASPMPESARTPQQNTLLNLLRTPSDSSVRPPASAAPQPQLAPSEPVELSAAPNTPRTERPPGQIQILQRPKPINIDVSKSLGDTKEVQAPMQLLHRHHPSGQISATVSGPLTTPDFSTLQKHESQQPNSVAMTGTGSTREPFIIAGSPQSAASTIRPSKPEPDRHERVVAAQEKQRDTSRPFQPRVLQRPKQAQQTPARPTSNASMSQFDRRDSLPQDLRHNLLSLFGNSATQSPVLAMGSPLANPTEKNQAARHVSPVLASRSRLESVTSAASAASSAQMGISQSRRDSGSGRQTPVTPKDRDFLMDYLHGVVKGGK